MLQPSTNCFRFAVKFYVFFCVFDEYVRQNKKNVLLQLFSLYLLFWNHRKNDKNQEFFKKITGT